MEDLTINCQLYFLLILGGEMFSKQLWIMKMLKLLHRPWYFGAMPDIEKKIHIRSLVHIVYLAVSIHPFNF